MADVRQFRTQNGTLYNFRDSRVDTLNQFDYGACTSAEDTPYGVEWEKDGTTITGTLVASVQTMYRIYLVPSEDGEGNDIFDEYITMKNGVDPSYTYTWEKLGSITVPDLSNYVSKTEAGALAYEDTASGSFTPEGTVSKPSITVTETKSNIPNVESVGTVPAFSVENEVLIFDPGTTPSLGTAISALTGASAELDAAPTFTGTVGTVTVSAQEDGV